MESTMDLSLKHAKNLAQELSNCSVRYIIHIALKELGVSSSREGFLFAKNTILLLCENPSSKLKHGVYLAAGILCDPPADDEQVEQAIRGAIREAWKDRDTKVWNCYFPMGKSGRTVCSSNRDFLMAVVDFVELWHGCCEEVNYERV